MMKPSKKPSTSITQSQKTYKYVHKHEIQHIVRSLRQLFTPFCVRICQICSCQIQQGGNCIGNMGVILLTKANLFRLEQLNLSDTHIGDNAIKYLSKADHPNLIALWLTQNRIELDGYYNIYAHNHKNLHMLHLWQNKSNCMMVLVLIQSPQISTNNRICNSYLKQLIQMILKQRWG